MKGIREFTNANFAASLPKVRTGEMTQTAFRKEVMDLAILAYGISVASAATHYNFSLKTMREVDPVAVEGIGRPEGKKGGRKPTHLVDVIKVKTGEVVAAKVAKAVGEALVIKAAEAKKAKLVIREIANEVPADAPAVEAVAETPAVEAVAEAVAA
jgi:hypothetical protein